MFHCRSITAWYPGNFQTDYRLVCLRGQARFGDHFCVLASGCARLFLSAQSAGCFSFATLWACMCCWQSLFGIGKAGRPGGGWRQILIKGLCLCIGSATLATFNNSEDPDRSRHSQRQNIARSNHLAGRGDLVGINSDIAAGNQFLCQ